MVPTVVEALLNTASPVVVRLVAVALARVVWPATFNVPESVSPVPDAVEKYVWPDTVRAVAEAVASVV